MAYPPDVLAADKTDDTPTDDDHAPHHNALADAVNDVVDELGDDPKGAAADLTARLATLDTTVAAKAATSALTTETTNRTAADTAEASARAAADTAEAAARAAADALAIPLTQKAAANGVATLGADSKIPTAQIPSLSIVSTFTVGSQAAMLATNAQQGDLAVRTDESKTYILGGADATQLVNWVQLATPTDAVLSVNGQTGAVALAAADVAAVPVATFDANTILKADSDNTPVALSMGASTILARLASGGIVAASPAQLRTLLALVIGTDVQAYDADLAALAGLTSAADKLPYFTGSGTASVADFTAAGRALVDDADTTAQRATLGLTVGTDVQAYDAKLAALAALAPVNNRMLYFTGASTMTLTTSTSFGRTMGALADAAAGRTALAVPNIAGDTFTGNVRIDAGLGISINPATRVGIGTTPGSGSIDITAGLVVKPSSDDAAGIVIVVDNATYGQTTHANYGTFPFMIVDKHSTETIQGGSARFYIDANGSPQFQGWMHCATGQNDATFRGGSLPTQAMWIQPGIDCAGLVITQPSGGTKTLLHITNNAGSTTYLSVTAAGVVSVGPGGLASTGYVVSYSGTGAQTTIGDIGGVKGGISFSSSGDAQIYRATANSIASNSDLTARAGTSLQAFLGSFFALPGVVFGSAADTALWRTAANQITTGDLVTGHHTFGDAKNIVVNATTGTKIGTGTTQKIAFWNKTPIVQPTALPAAATDLATAITLVNDIRTKLTSLGLVA